MSYGIDFGTTNSAIVYKGQTLGVGDDRPFPSVVAFHRVTGEIICGPEARRARESLEQQDYLVIPSVKRLLGSGESWSIGGKVLTPTDVAAELFKALRRHAQSDSRSLGTHLDSAVVSIPVGFQSHRRRELRAAARSAGIEISAFVSEPTAAWFQCRSQIHECRRVVVFDWGGGTLDISVLKILGDEVTELSTAGLERAGDYIDLEIAHWAHSEIMRQRGDTTKFDEMPAADRDRLVAQSELAKIALSSHSSRTIQVYPYGPHDLVQLTFSDEQLRLLTQPLVETAMELVQAGLRRAQVSQDEIDAVILIGGSSRLSSLQERMRAHFAGRVWTPPQPDWTVAEGASRLAEFPGRYELRNRIALILSDDTHYAVLPSDATFDNTWHDHYLGLVEESHAAELVFAEVDTSTDNGIDTNPGSRRILYLTVPVQGLWHEPIHIRSRLTPDMTFEVEASTTHGKTPEDVRRTAYEHLRFIYRMPR